MYTLTALSLLAGFAAANKCINATVPVTISSRNAVFGNLATPQNNLGATRFALNDTRQGTNFTNIALTGYHTVEGTYHISTEFCMPDNFGTEDEGYGWHSHYSQSGGVNDTKPIVQVLTHGIGFDKTYWDFSYDNFNYSYVDYVNERGYCTLAYDRLGIHNSSHGEPRDEIQSFLEEAALHELVTMLRNGTFPNIHEKFTEVIGVGHSFGSAQTYAVANLYPEDFNAIVLTGFTMNATFVGYFVLGANFIQSNEANETDLLDYPNGYLINSDVEAQETLFFYPPYFDIGVLETAEATKQPVTVGEILTLGSLVMNNSYTGPVLVVDGEFDLPYCGGDCVNTGNPAMTNIGDDVAKNFPLAKSFESYIQPNTGHGINLHYNSTGAYGVIQTWLASEGYAA